MSVDSTSMSTSFRLPLVVCVLLSVVIAMLRLGPVFWSPSQYSVGGWGHPDNLGNHWLLVWVAERLWMGESILHNTEYYVPVGDYPWLAGNGSEGLLYAPFHWLLDWPTGVVPLVVLYFVGIGLGGYTIAIQAGVGKWGALIGSVVLTSSGFWTREMNAGRFSQLDGMWLLLSLGLFIGLCTQIRSNWWIVMCGFCIGLTGVFYWYYAYFFVLSAIVFVVCALLFKQSLQWKQIIQAALVSWIAVAPVAVIYWQNWDLVPGVDEGVFPSPDAFSDAMTLSGSWLVPFGRTAGAVQSIPTLLLSVVGCMQIKRFNKHQRWVVFSALMLCLVFGLLAFGPKTPIFEWVYGWTPPLRRFWWPSRHLVIWTVGFSILASMGADVVIERCARTLRWSISIGLALLVPLSFWMQGDRPFHAMHTPIEHPVTAYLPIAELDGDVLMMPPINPKVANTQLPLLLQLTHEKRLLTGHGMWVDRVRPESWDQFVQSNGLLASLSAYEVGEGAELTVNESDIRALEAEGMELIVLDAKLFPRPLMGLVSNLAKIYTVLFDQPIHRGEQLRVWSIANWTGVTKLDAPPWTLPPNVTLGNGRHKMPDPVEGRGVR